MPFLTQNGSTNSIKQSSNSAPLVCSSVSTIDKVTHIVNIVGVLLDAWHRVHIFSSHWLSMTRIVSPSFYPTVLASMHFILWSSAPTVSQNAPDDSPWVISFWTSLARVILHIATYILHTAQKLLLHQWNYFIRSTCSVASLVFLHLSIPGVHSLCNTYL